VSKQVGKSAVG